MGRETLQWKHPNCSSLESLKCRVSYCVSGQGQISVWAALSRRAYMTIVWYKVTFMVKARKLSIPKNTKGPRTLMVAKDPSGPKGLAAL